MTTCYDPDLERRFAQRMRAVREARGWSQQELADRAGIPHRSALSQMENGRRGIPLAEAVALAEALTIPLHDMIAPGRLLIRQAGPLDIRVEAP